MKIRLIHGIHEPEGLTNMGMFAGHVRGVSPNSDVSLFKYGFLGFWKARFENTEIAHDFSTMSKLERRTDEQEVWITHSNGAAIAYLAVEKFGATPNLIININPALDRWRTAGVRRVVTIHSEGDRWVNLSQWLPGHIWGDQGKVGYRGRLNNTINVDACKMDGVMAYQGHCDMFEPERINQWAHYMVQQIYVSTGVRP